MIAYVLLAVILPIGVWLGSYVALERHEAGERAWMFWTFMIVTYAASYLLSLTFVTSHAAIRGGQPYERVMAYAELQFYFLCLSVACFVCMAVCLWRDIRSRGQR